MYILGCKSLYLQNHERYYVAYVYGTARFKLQACVSVRHVRFAFRYGHFSKSCVSVGNCTGILRAMHARMTSGQ